MTLTKHDLGPKRRLFDKSVRYVMAVALGWMMCEMFWNVSALPGLKANSLSWYAATTDKFAGVCETIYGPKRAPASNDQARR